jgi:hypothetical protein
MALTAPFFFFTEELILPPPGMDAVFGGASVSVCFPCWAALCLCLVCDGCTGNDA